MKKIVRLLLFVVLIVAAWYLFIKPYDYVVRFPAKTTVGTINQSIKSWYAAIEGTEIIDDSKFDELKQQFKFGDSTHLYTWKIEALTDSTSRVKVYVKDREHSFANKLAIPFSKTAIEKRSEATVKEFYDVLNSHLKKTKVTINGEDATKETYVAYTPLKGLQVEKAKGMMYNYSLLTQIMLKGNVALNGPPFVEVTHWDTKTDSISYNFCFPIKKSDSLPTHPEIKYKQYHSRKALKATYNGNYITSDRAWYALHTYANSHNIPVDLTPVEVFYNNPNMGGDELKWKAEIFMPIKE
ncbi:GyrI-like domain-containing protein [uncultured Dokdonia sp.]|uniref:GyrI-like domain-containing protein n=1 Tax=uncultured Dokdonia sp. TaxID=575653 RepID=UPI0026392AAA|nr:GyrI-like domain-containing protein [uncultured Dokdonia sp.]